MSEAKLLSYTMPGKTGRAARCLGLGRRSRKRGKPRSDHRGCVESVRRPENPRFKIIQGRSALRTGCRSRSCEHYDDWLKCSKWVLVSSRTVRRNPVHSNITSCGLSFVQEVRPSWRRPHLAWSTANMESMIHLLRRDHLLLSFRSGKDG